MNMRVALKMLCLAWLAGVATPHAMASGAAPKVAAKPAAAHKKPEIAAPAALPVDAKADIARVETYLSGITTISADFVQVSADGSLASGKFYLKRPGKMRWQYAPPSSVQLISNGSTIVYYDPAVQQVSYVPVDETMAGFLAQKDIRFESASTRLAKFEAAAGVIRATLVQKKKPTEGSLTLEFADNPLQLRQMTVSDATGQETHVQLQNAQFGGALDDALFVFKDPRGVIPPKGVKR